MKLPLPPAYVAAAVQASPVFLDTSATVRRACELVEEAASQGATLVVFPESYVSAYPYWNWIGTPFEGSAWFRRLYEQSIEVPGPHTERLGQAARAHGVHVVIGVNERDPVVPGTIYNTNVVIGPDGRVLGAHRKLVPTWAEKLTWTGGDGSSLRVYDTEIGPLGTLACGENTNTLARYSLLAQGELVHVANFPAFPFTTEYDMPGAIQLRAGAHAFEGKVFSVVSCSVITDEIVDMLAGDDVSRRSALGGTPNAFSGIFGPDGRLVSEGLVDREGIVYGEIDLGRCIEPRQLHNIAGHYNRFDVFDLAVDRRAKRPVRFSPDDRPAPGWASAPPDAAGEADPAGAGTDGERR